MKIVKCIKAAIWAIGFFLLSTQVMAASIPVVSFGISDNDIQINETFSVDVLVSGVDPLSFDEVIAFGFDLNLDPTWSLTAPITIGPAFDFNDSALFLDTDVAGSVDFLNFGPSGDNILLANLQLSASSAGLFDFGIISDLFDFNEGIYLFSSFDAFDLTHTEQLTINATASSSVPEPSTFWLLLFSALTFLIYKKSDKFSL